MIMLFSPEDFIDYLDTGFIDAPDFDNNGAVVLQPTTCDLEAELGGVWSLKMTHPYDAEGRYTYICRDAVIKAPCKIAREQKTEWQLFRIYEVRDNMGELEVLANPIALDAIYETPIYKKKYIRKDLGYIVKDLNTLYPEKYHIRYADKGHIEKSFVATDTNLQAMIMGDNDYSILNNFKVEMIYDNYDYVLEPSIGDNTADDTKIFRGVNLSGINITENTSKVVTRIYPVSGDGLPLIDKKGEAAYVDISEVLDETELAKYKYPFVHAAAKQYDDLKLFEERDSDSRHPKGVLQTYTQQAKSAVKKMVAQQSLHYLKQAHEGNWDFTSRLTEPVKDDGNSKYLDQFAWRKTAAGWYYGDENNHMLKSAWVTKTSSFHYYVNAMGYYDDSKDNTQQWGWHGNNEVGWWYGVYEDGEQGEYAKSQWLYIPEGGPTGGHHEYIVRDEGDGHIIETRIFDWYWFNERGYLEEGSNYNTADHPNYHDPDAPYDQIKDRFGLPFGYIFFSYTDAIEHLKDRALMDIGAKADNPEGESESEGEDQDAKDSDNVDSKREKDESSNKENDSEIWQMFADAIQQGFKWVETTEIAAWDWNEDITMDDGYQGKLKNYLTSMSWHEDGTDAQGNKRWWYGYYDKQKDKYYYIKNGWVEDGPCAHYWCDSDGYYIENTESEDLVNTWDWHDWTNGEKWYGYSDPSGAAVAFPRHQYMYVTADGNWRWFNSNGIWETPDSKWYYGTKDGTDRVLLGWWKIGDWYWWFDKEGYVHPTLAYITEYDWQEDETGQWYGDGKGHYLTSCWVEKSSSDHYYVGEDGYYIKPEEDDDDDSSSSDDSSSDDSSSDDSSSDDSSGDDEETEDPNHDTEEWSWHTDYVNYEGAKAVRYWYGRYEKDEDGNDTETIKYQMKDQFIYVTDDKTWYRFDKEGYCIGAWLSNSSWSWHHDDNGWWYGDKKGAFPAGQWMKIDGKWYWFDLGGYADASTDDYKNKTSSTDTGTLDTNREGINPNYSTGAIDSDEAVSKESFDRDGVQAWITEDFIELVRFECNQQYDKLRDQLNLYLRGMAELELKSLYKPTITIEVNFETLEKVQGYSQYEFLREKYLGDKVTVYYVQRGEPLEERIVGVTYDCIERKIKNVTLGYPKNYIYQRTAGLLLTGSKSYASADIDTLESGYGDNLSVSKRRQNLEG